MSLLSKLQPVIIFLSAILGLLLGYFTPLRNIDSIFIEIFLMLLLYMLFMSIDVKNLRKSFLSFRYTATAICINFIITPCIAYMIGNIFFEDMIPVRIGIMMLLVTPCTDWYLVFTGLSKGNLELNVSILPLNLLLQVVLMPIYLRLFFGAELTISIYNMIQSIVFVLIIPFFASMISKVLIKNKTIMKEYIAEQNDNFQLLFLCLAVIVMFASEGESLVANPLLFIQMCLPLCCFFIFIFFLAQAIGRLMKMPKQDIIALNFTTLARNSPLALAIAVSTFPSEPLIALTLIAGSLIELPILSMVSAILLHWKYCDSNGVKQKT